MKIIATIRNDYKEKFGIPRQSGLAPEILSAIVFEPEYRVPEALRGIEQFSHLWLFWSFSKAERDTWSPTVRPPRLGGNTRVGVFATRSPFRPNAVGLSCVTLKSVSWDTPDGPVLIVGGADLLDGTPIYDIKPYIPYADCHPEASEGFTSYTKEYLLKIDFPEELLNRIVPGKQKAVSEVLAQDPRPSYQNDPDRVYGMRFGEYEIRFRVRDGILTVCDVLAV